MVGVSYRTELSDSMVDTSDYKEVKDGANGSTCNQRAGLWNWSTVAEPPVALLPNYRLSRTAAARVRRIVLYSHDSMGLGHTRRNLLLAQTIAAANPLTDILLIVGEREGTPAPATRQLERGGIT